MIDSVIQKLNLPEDTDFQVYAADGGKRYTKIDTVVDAGFKNGDLGTVPLSLLFSPVPPLGYQCLSATHGEHDGLQTKQKRSQGFDPPPPFDMIAFRKEFRRKYPGGTISQELFVYDALVL